MKKYKWLFPLLLLVLILPARVISIDKFATIDEPWWIISGSNYYYALAHRDFENTVYDYHPAVTTTWVVAAGMASYFPEYRGLGQGYFDVRKPLFEEFMREQGKDLSPLVRNSRLVQVGVLTVLALLSFFLLASLVGEATAFLAIVLAVNAPFFLGNSRLINHESMLAMFAAVSFLSLQVYLGRERRIIYLFVSGAAFGLAQLTKSSSIVLLALVGLVLFVRLFERNGKTLASKLWDAAKIFAIWLAAAVFVYVILWPGMWVAPQKMLYEVFGNAFSYAFQGARLDVTGELQPSHFSLLAGLDGVVEYLNRWLASSTPITWLGVILALFIFTCRDKSLTPSPLRSTTAYLVVLAALFIAMFSVARGRDSTHYILTSFVGLDLVAGIGWGFALPWVQKRLPQLNHDFFVWLILILLAAFQLGSSLLYYPYYFTYKNPFIARGGVYGYGEGLDQGAEYLAQKPNPAEMRVISYAARGCFSYFFPGESDLLKIGFRQDGLPYIEDMQRADYLVLYPVRQRYKDNDAKLVSFLEDVPTEHTIFINGIEYVRVYKVDALPRDIYDILSTNK